MVNEYVSLGEIAPRIVKLIAEKRAASGGAGRGEKNG